MDVDSPFLLRRPVRDDSLAARLWSELTQEEKE